MLVSGMMSPSVRCIGIPIACCGAAACRGHLGCETGDVPYEFLATDYWKTEIISDATEKGDRQIPATSESRWSTATPTSGIVSAGSPIGWRVVTGFLIA
jgi:hypothetical protein